MSYLKQDFLHHSLCMDQFLIFLYGNLNDAITNIKPINMLSTPPSEYLVYFNPAGEPFFNYVCYNESINDFYIGAFGSSVPGVKINLL